MTAPDLQPEAIEVLQSLIRFNTVNPPGNERAAINYLDGYLSAAGLETEQLAADPARPNLIATLTGLADGPTMVYLAHVDTVLANPEDWQQDPWSGAIEGGFLWGRGAIDMKSQAAAEAVAIASLARSGWRPAHGTVKLVFVADEEAGGADGARWLTEQHPEKVRCDLLFNEGAGSAFELDGRRRYGVCCGEKGIFRFKLTAHGAAGHASMPGLSDNALLKLVPVLQRLTEVRPSFDPTEAPLALVEALGGDPTDPGPTLERLAAADPRLPEMVGPMLGVTFAPTMIQASEKINVVPAHASLKIDCRVPPGLGADIALKRLHEALGDSLDGLDVEFTEQVYGYVSPTRSVLMDAIERWLAANDPGAQAVPLLLAGYSDSSYFRKAFPELIAYGFFPHRHQTMPEAMSMMHNSDERIDVRDLGYAARFFYDVALDLLG
jgi:acetylornithine deacetylase/succinyl-diaminopimelate desuccinylase-like protein